MVYDNSETWQSAASRQTHEPGFSIHKVTEEFRPPLYNIYTDDGRGNGNYICETFDLEWARRIAKALDERSWE